tara:strand:- start:14665 stop:15243 length:579 start_codon:yes stop_codon:yes gene_type:complete
MTKKKRRRNEVCKDLPGERWKTIPGYPDVYEVSSFGRARTWVGKGRSMKQGRGKVAYLMNLLPDKAGYLRVRMTIGPKNIKTPFIHQLVLLAFVGPRPEGYLTRHLDGCPQNNVICNLAWGTYKQNADDRKVHGTNKVGEDNPNSKITEDIVREIRVLCKGSLKQREIAARFGISQQEVSQIKRRLIWKHVD